MSSPTTRASNVWSVDGGDDILQIVKQGAGVLSGIDATGAGFGALIGGGSSFGVAGAVASPVVGTTNLPDGVSTNISSKTITLPSDGKQYSFAVLVQSLINIGAGASAIFVTATLDGTPLSQSSGLALTPGSIPAISLTGFFSTTTLTGDGSTHTIEMFGESDGDDSIASNAGFIIIPILGSSF